MGAIPYPLQWINVNFGVKQLIIIIILEIPLLNYLVDIWSITNKSCNIREIRKFSSLRPKLVSINSIDQLHRVVKPVGLTLRLEILQLTMKEMLLTVLCFIYKL